MNQELAPRLLGHDEGLELLRNRYFLLGMGVQKGTPILIMPLSIAAVGVAVYSEYVLLYTVVQTVAIVTGLCVSQAFIPFWFDHADKKQYLGSFTAVMLAVQALLSIPLGVVLHFSLWPSLNAKPVLYLPLLLAYAAIYNLNALAVSLIRVQLRQWVFLVSTLLTAGMLAGLIVLTGRAPGDKLLLYTGANVLTLFLQTVFYLYFARVTPPSMLPRKQLRRFAQGILAFSGPLTIYTLIALVALVADKWFVKFFFDNRVFTQYVVDFQFAFSVALLSVVIGMYNGPKLCQLTHEGARRELRRNVIGNYVVSLVGSLAISLVAFAYARVGGIYISSGYWILAAGFALNNCYAVNSSLLTAQKRGRTLACIGTSAALVLVIVLWICGAVGSSRLVYFACAGYQALLLALSSLSLSSVFQHRSGSQELAIKLEEVF